MIQAKQELLHALSESIAELSPHSSLGASFESPKQAAHGDLACTVAMQLAKPLKKNPRELAQALIDALNAEHTRGAVMPTEFTRTTLSMHFYDSVVVFERGRHTEKFAPQLGRRPE